MSLCAMLKGVSSSEIDQLIDSYAARLSALFGAVGFEAFLDPVLADRRVTKQQLLMITRLLDRPASKAGTRANIAQWLVEQHREAIVQRRETTLRWQAELEARSARKKRAA